jgi:hypothetical protein
VSENIQLSTGENHSSKKMKQDDEKREQIKKDLGKKEFEENDFGKKF